MLKVVLACIGNSCRSQMAEGFAKHYGKDILDVYSCGSNPSGIVYPTAIEMMKEKGIDISDHYSKGFNDLPKQEYDYVITMGCGDNCPYINTKNRIDWQIEDPVGRSDKKFREVRDIIEQKIKEFIKAVKKT